MKLKILLIVTVLVGPLWAETSAEKQQQIERAIAQQGAAWQTAESWVTELSLEELKTLCGAPLSDPSSRADKERSIPRITDLPVSFDWRNNAGNWVTPPRDQSTCGSCVIFAALAQMESVLKIQSNDPFSDFDLSEQFLVSTLEGSCEGGWERGRVFDFMRDVGVPNESCFPYTAKDTLPASLACDDWQQQARKIAGWNYISKEEVDVELIKSAVYRHPVSVFMNVYADFSYYSGGVYEHVWGESVGGHGILLVGWSDSEQSWICKNSWGSEWGDEGYFRIKWNEGNIGTNMVFIWNQTSRGPALTTEPSELDVFMDIDSSVEKNLVIQNNSADAVEFAAMDFSVPIAFHPSSYNAYDDSSWWCADPEIMGYNNHWLQYLDTPVIDISSTQNPKLSWMGYWSIEGTAGADAPWDGWDGCNVWVSTDSGETFKVMQPEYPAYNSTSLWSFGHDEQGWDMGTGIPGWGGKSNGWTAVEFDLSSYKSRVTVIRFAFASDLAFCTRDDSTVNGLFVDEIKVSDGGSVLFYDSGNNFNQMKISGFGEEKSRWFEFADLTSNIIPPQSTLTLPFRLHSTQLEKGKHQGMIEIVNNIVGESPLQIPIHVWVGLSTSLPSNRLAMPGEWQLRQNYPNPFNPVTTIEYFVAEPSRVTIALYDLLGRKVADLVNNYRTTGLHSIQWDGRDENGRKLSSGVYVYHMTAGAFTEHKKMIMVK